MWLIYLEVIKLDKNCGIYLILNKANGKGYVGQSKNIKQRWVKHKSDLNRKTHSNQHLQRAWNKYGKENFDFLILEYCSQNLLLQSEAFWVIFLDTKNNGYNLIDGGIATPILFSENNPMYGKHHSMKSRLKMSESQPPQNGHNNNHSIYQLWQSNYCHFHRNVFFRNSNKKGLNPRKAFYLSYKGKQLQIGAFIDFMTPNIIGELINQFVGED